MNSKDNIDNRKLDFLKDMDLLWKCAGGTSDCCGPSYTEVDPLFVNSCDFDTSQQTSLSHILGGLVDEMSFGGGVNQFWADESQLSILSEPNSSHLGLSSSAITIDEMLHLLSRKFLAVEKESVICNLSNATTDTPYGEVLHKITKDLMAHKDKFILKSAGDSHMDNLYCGLKPTLRPHSLGSQNLSGIGKS